MRDPSDDQGARIACGGEGSAPSTSPLNQQTAIYAIDKQDLYDAPDGLSSGCRRGDTRISITWGTRTWQAPCFTPHVRFGFGLTSVPEDDFVATPEKAQFQGSKAVKSLQASMVNRVLTSPYLWWFDGFPVLGYVPRPFLKVLAFQTWQ
jgi:hypothetical protein